MRDIAKFGIILMIVAAFSAGSLAIVYNATEGKRKEVQEEEKQAALLDVLPTAKVFEPVKSKDIYYYIGYESRDKKKAAGYAFIAEGKGYSSTIETMVGITPEGTITGLKILSQKETPGLGARIEEVRSGKTLKSIFLKSKEKETADEKPWFQKQFVGKNPDELHTENMQIITGATISSKAVIDSVREKLKEILVEEGTHQRSEKL